MTLKKDEPNIQPEFGTGDEIKVDKFHNFITKISEYIIPPPDYKPTDNDAATLEIKNSQDSEEHSD